MNLKNPTCIFQVSKFDFHDIFIQHNTYQKLEEWSQEGKDVKKFDHKWMGLFMFTAPTQQFGWEGLTKTMKAVNRKHIFKFWKIGIDYHSN